MTLCDPFMQEDAEKIAINAQKKYVSALSEFERLSYKALAEDDDAIEIQLKEAKRILIHCRTALDASVKELGYVPDTFSAKLPPEPQPE